MTIQPKITIVTIAYNSEKTIEQTIKSVVGQSYENTEYVIVDGASTDKTLDIVGKYSNQIDRIVSEPDQGISDAFNKGISLATGDIVCLLNSDDILLPDSLERVAKEYDGNTDIYCGNVLMWNEKSGMKCREIPSVYFPLMPFFCHVAHQGMFVTKRCYNTIGTYDITIRFPMDLEFLVRASKHGMKFHYMNIDVALFRIGGATDSNSIFEKKNDYLYMVRKNGGSQLQAYIYYYFLVLTQVAKKVLMIFGIDRLRRWRYGKA